MESAAGDAVGLYDIFISYDQSCSADLVRQLAEHLEANYNVWCDRTEGTKEKGSILEPSLTEAIEFADLVLVCISSDCKFSEANYAVSHGKIVLFLRMKDHVTIEAQLVEDYLSQAALENVSKRIKQILAERSQEILANRQIRLVASVPQPKFVLGRATAVDQVAEKLEILCKNPSNGAFLISGPRGSGKTTFLLHCLLEKSHLLTTCNVKTIFWLNCNCWRNPSGSFNEDAKQGFRQRLLRIARSRFRLINDLACHKPLFVFDDVFDVALVDFVVKELCLGNNFPCIVVTDDDFESILQMGAGIFLSNSERIAPLGEKDVETIFKNALGLEALKKIEPRQFAKLVASFQGMPKKAVDCGYLLKNCNDLKQMNFKIDDFINQPASKKTFDHRPTSLADLRYSKRGPVTAIRKKLQVPAKSVELGRTPEDQDKGSKKEKKPFTLIDVPDFVFHKGYYPRNLEEDALKESIRKAVEGLVLIVGPSGSGKTTLISKMLRNESNQTFLRRRCNVQTCIWLNCYEWSDGEMSKKDVEAFSKALSELCRRSLSEYSIEDVKSRNRRILFILDDVSNPSVLDAFQSHFRGLPTICCALTNQVERFQHQIATKHCMAPLREAELIEMFETVFDLKDKLNAFQLKQLTKRCNGSPFIARILAGYFTNNGRNHLSKFDYLTSQDTKELLLFGQLDEDAKKRYSILALFDPIDQINAQDLEVIFGLETTEALEDMGYAQRIRLGPWDHLGTAFVVHEILHDEIVKKSKVANEKLSESRLRIMTEIGEKLLGSRGNQASNLAAFMFKSVEQDMSDLVERSINCFPIGSFKEISKQRIVEYFEDIRIEPKTSSSKTALQIAIQHGDFDLIDMLCHFLPKSLEQAEKSGMSPLMFAAETGNLEVVKYLFKKRPEMVSLQDASGQSALAMAVHNHHWPVVEFLAERLPPKRVATREVIFDAIQEAAFHCNLHILEFLVEKCSNGFEIQEKEALCLIRGAAVRGLLPVVNYFHEPWRDVIFTLPKNEFGQTVLMEAAISSQLQIVEYFHKRFPNSIEMTDNKWQTVMMVAGASKFYHDLHENMDKLTLPVMKFLVEKWPEGVDKKDLSGKTALFYAAKRGFAETFEFLLSKSNEGVQEIQNHGWELATSIIEDCNLEMLKAVHKTWPNFLDLHDEDGATPLIFAAALEQDEGERRIFPIIKFFVDLMAQEQVEERDSSGRSALVYAGYRGYLESFRLILSTSRNARETIKEHAQYLLPGVVESGNLQLLQTVLQACPEVLKMTFENGMSLLMLAVSKCPVEDGDEDESLMPMVKFILEKWRDCASLQDEEGLTARLYAQQRDYQSTLEFLRQFSVKLQ